MGGAQGVRALATPPRLNRASRPTGDGAGGPGAGRAAGLAAASLAVMVGLVFAANPARYGLGGALLGAGLMAVGVMAAFRLFRAGG